MHLRVPAVEAPAAPPTPTLRRSELIGALSYALDLTEGQPAGHCVRCCWIGMHVGRVLGFDEARLHDLYYTLLLKDAGCSSNAARLFELYGEDDHRVKNDYKVVDNQNMVSVARFVLEHAGVSEGMLTRLRRLGHLVAHGRDLANELVETRCERGADIALRLGFGERVADGIRYLDEHWNGKGRPYAKSGGDVPLESQIALLAQVVDVFRESNGPEQAVREARRRRSTWFGPDVVDAFLTFEHDEEFWRVLASPEVDLAVRDIEPQAYVMVLDEDRLDEVADAFAMVVDAKSRFTADHSRRVADLTVAVAQELGFPAERVRWLRRAALLHDVGKLGVSNAVLDKPARLSEEEWVHVRQHARLSEEILARVGPFAELARVAGAHHERLDGKGYPRGLGETEIRLETRIITVSDIFDAITAERPYRGPIPHAKALEMMHEECPAAVDPDCLAALHRVARNFV